MFGKIENNLNIEGNGRRPQFFWQMEDNLNILLNGEVPHCQPQARLKPKRKNPVLFPIWIFPERDDLGLMKWKTT